MNIPNKLSLLRIFLIIPYVVFMQGEAVFGEMSIYIALIIFIVASLTDTLDGYIARKYNLITNFGKLVDPLADKLLVCAALICLMEKGLISSIVLIIIISREFIISGFRLIAVEEGIVIAAGIWGKLKTISQMVMLIFLMLYKIKIFYILGNVFIYISVGLTVFSLIEYVYKNRTVITKGDL